MYNVFIINSGHKVMCLSILRRKAMTIMTPAVECSLMTVECNLMKLLCSMSLKVFHVLHKKVVWDYKYKYLITNGVLLITIFLFQLQSMYRTRLDKKRKMWPHPKQSQLSLVLKQVKNTLMLIFLMKYL